MVADYRWATVPLNFILSVVLLGIDEIAVEIEDPFGTDANDIELLPMLFKIDTDIAAILNDRHRRADELDRRPPRTFFKRGMVRQASGKSRGIFRSVLESSSNGGSNSGGGGGGDTQ